MERESELVGMSESLRRGGGRAVSRQYAALGRQTTAAPASGANLGF